jgi:hypothetical protein
MKENCILSFYLIFTFGILAILSRNNNIINATGSFHLLKPKINKKNKIAYLLANFMTASSNFSIGTASVTNPISLACFPVIRSPVKRSRLDCFRKKRIVRLIEPFESVMNCDGTHASIPSL